MFSFLLRTLTQDCTGSTKSTKGILSSFLYSNIFEECPRYRLIILPKFSLDDQLTIGTAKSSAKLFDPTVLKDRSFGGMSPTVAINSAIECFNSVKYVASRIHMIT